MAPLHETDHPFCNCALLCDDVLESRGRGKHILHGVIGTIAVREFPALVGGYVAYVRITNVKGKRKVSLSFDLARTNEPVFVAETELPDQKDPLGMYTLVVPIPRFAVMEPGRYIFSVKSAGVPLAESPIVLMQIVPPQLQMDGQQEE